MKYVLQFFVMLTCSIVSSHCMETNSDDDIERGVPTTLTPTAQPQVIVRRRGDPPLMPVPDNPTVINLNEDIPGCVDDYFRFCVGFWRISEFWFEFGAYATTSAGVFVMGLATKGNFDESTRESLGTAGLVLGGVGLFLQGFKTYSTSAVDKHRRALGQVILEAHRNPMPTSTIAQI